jgi:hypothetical protein
MVIGFNTVIQREHESRVWHSRPSWNERFVSVYGPRVHVARRPNRSSAWLTLRCAGADTGNFRRSHSVIVVLKLMAHRQDVDMAGILDLVQRNVAYGAQRNQQLPQEGALSGLAIDERCSAQIHLDGLSNGIDRGLSGVEDLYGFCTIQQVVKQPKQVRSSPVCIANLVGSAHPSAALRRASRLRCSSV